MTRIPLGLLLALLIGLCLQVVITLRSQVLDEDGTAFIRMARAMSNDPIATIQAEDQHPGYPALILISRHLLDFLIPSGLETTNQDSGVSSEALRWQRSARLVPFACGLLAIWLVYELSRRAAGLAGAAPAAILFAALPLFRRNAANALSDSLSLALVLASIVFVMRGDATNRRRYFVLCGALSGIAYLVRPEGLEVVLVVALLQVLPLRSGEARPWRSRCARLLLLFIGALPPVLPYALLIGGLTKKTPISLTASDSSPGLRHASAVPTPASPGTHPADATPAGTEGPWDAALPPETSSPPRSSPLMLCLEALLLISRLIIHNLKYILLLPLALGLFQTFRLSVRSPATRLLLLLAVTHVSLLIQLYSSKGYISGRHVMPLLAILFPWVGLGILALRSTVQRSRLFGFASRVIGSTGIGSTALIVAALGLPLLPSAIRPLHPESKLVLQAVRFLRSQSSPADGIVTNSSWFLFYTGREGCLLYQGRLPIPGWCTKPIGLCDWFAFVGDAPEIDAILSAHSGTYRRTLSFSASAIDTALRVFVGKRIRDQ